MADYTVLYDKDNLSLQESVYASEKTATARVDVPYYVRSNLICTEARKNVLRALNNILTPGRVASNVRLEILITGTNDDLIDFGRYSVVLNQVRKALENAGLPIVSFSYRFKRGDKDQWTFSMKFFEVEKAVNDKQWKRYQ